MEDEQYKRMTETPVERLICQLALPTITSMLVTAIYNSADAYFVGKLGNERIGRGGGCVLADDNNSGGRLYRRNGSREQYFAAFWARGRMTRQT